MIRKKSDKDKRKKAGKKRGALDVGKKKSRHLDGVKNVDVQDVGFLQNFVTDYGKIQPARLTGANSRQQRQIKKGVRRARNIGLLA
jgi:small subunit ribosomal protein S18